MRCAPLPALPLAIAAAGALAVVLFVDVPMGDSRSQAIAFDLGHVPAFALVAVALLAVARRGIPAARRRPGPAAAIAAGAATLIGAAVEGAQALLGRDAEIMDIVHDLAGACLGVGLVRLLELRNRRGRLILAALCVGVLMATGFPLGNALVDERRARRQFPVLASFESSVERDRFIGWQSRLAISKEHAADGAHCLRAALLPGPTPYSRICLQYFPRDWRGYRALAFTIWNPGPRPVMLEIRINDVHHDETYADRFNARLALRPGRNDLEIPLARVRAAPRSREMDLSAVRTMTIFASALSKPVVFYLDAIRLVP